MLFDAAGLRRAIDVRASRRAYDRTMLTPGESTGIRRFCAEYRPFPGARVELIEDPRLDAFDAAGGGYGRITGATAMVVVIADATIAAGDTNAGYIGEAAILEATRLGLSTCWTHRYFSAPKVTPHLKMAYGEHIIAASPVGHAKASPSLSERVAGMDKRSSGRLPLEVLATSGCVSHAGGFYRKMLEAARLAPSPMNRQAWRFSLDQAGRLCVSTAGADPMMGLSGRVDCGIAMLHMDVAAQAEGFEGRWDVSAGTSSATWEPDVLLSGRPMPE